MFQENIEMSNDFAGWAEPPRDDDQPRAFRVRNYQDYLTRLRLEAESPASDLVNTKQ